LQRHQLRSRLRQPVSPLSGDDLVRGQHRRLLHGRRLYHGRYRDAPDVQRQCMQLPLQHAHLQTVRIVVHPCHDLLCAVHRRVHLPLGDLPHHLHQRRRLRQRSLLPQRLVHRACGQCLCGIFRRLLDPL
jgi:hypothetical protein